jgi:hypothetical protein
MATPGIKKVIIPRSSLSAVNSSNEYLIRFRVVSDDKNIFSQWSPIFVVPNVPVQTITSSFERNGSQITITWNDPSSRPAYDIFLKTDNSEEYVFVETVLQRSYTFAHTANSKIRYLIQAEAMPKSINPVNKDVNERLKMFESQEISVV